MAYKYNTMIIDHGLVDFQVIVIVLVKNYKIKVFFKDYEIIIFCVQGMVSVRG